MAEPDEQLSHKRPSQKITDLLIGIESSPIIAQGANYVGSLNHKLYAFHLAGMTL